MKNKQPNILEVSKIFEDIIDNAKNFEGSDIGFGLNDDNVYERNIDFSSLEISIVGDFLFSRVARSTIIGFAMMGSKVNIIGPSELISNEIIRAYENLPLIKNGQITVYDEIEKPLMKSDIVMPLRIQKERFTSSFNLDFESYKKFWKIDEKLINNSNKNILIMHPGPVNEEIEISHKLVHSDKSLINLQVENGVFIRETIMRELLSWIIWF